MDQRQKQLHDLLYAQVICLTTDFKPYGLRERVGSDCSCECKHFAALEGTMGNDWGVCLNPKSPRFALLTFEHQGCPEYEGESDVSR